MGFAKTLWTVSRRLLALVVLGITFLLSAAAAYYFFSRGAEVAVPNVVGKTEKQAREAFQKFGLKVKIIDIYDSDAPSGTVIRQEPKAGSIVRQGFPIKIKISRPKATANTSSALPFSGAALRLMFFQLCLSPGGLPT